MINRIKNCRVLTKINLVSDITILISYIFLPFFTLLSFSGSAIFLPFQILRYYNIFGSTNTDDFGFLADTVGALFESIRSYLLLIFFYSLTWYIILILLGICIYMFFRDKETSFNFFSFITSVYSLITVIILWLLKFFMLAIIRSNIPSEEIATIFPNVYNMLWFFNIGFYLIFFASVVEVALNFIPSLRRNRVRKAKTRKVQRSSRQRAHPVNVSYNPYAKNNNQMRPNGVYDFRNSTGGLPVPVNSGYSFNQDTQVFDQINPNQSVFRSYEKPYPDNYDQLRNNPIGNMNSQTSFEEIRSEILPTKVDLVISPGNILSVRLFPVLLGNSVESDYQLSGVSNSDFEVELSSYEDKMLMKDLDSEVEIMLNHKLIKPNTYYELKDKDTITIDSYDIPIIIE